MVKISNIDNTKHYHAWGKTRKATVERKHLQIIFDKGLLLECVKNLLQHSNKKINDIIFLISKACDRCFSEEGIQGTGEDAQPH
jgi:hypothetical protein